MLFNRDSIVKLSHDLIAFVEFSYDSVLDSQPAGSAGVQE